MRFKNFEIWKLALFGLFQSYSPLKSNKIEESRRNTNKNSQHNPFNKNKNIKIWWKIKIIFTFQICEISECVLLLDHFWK
jgi:hypothetical protein